MGQFGTLKLLNRNANLNEFKAGISVNKEVQPTTFERYAIFQSGGKQYQALEGKTVALEKLEGEAGDVVSFDKVLFKKEATDKFEFGKPFLAEPIKAEIVKHTKGPKLIAFRFKRRKKVRVKKGHRQNMTVVRITSI